MTSQPLPPDDGAVTFTVSAVARRLGVATATLRTWDRRYGLGPSQHVSGCHRKYSEADLRRLQIMRRLVNQGLQAAEAARIALSSNGDDVVTRLRVASPEAKPVEVAAPAELIRGLSRAAESLDAFACQELITSALLHHGAMETWNSLLRPVLTHFGDVWQSSAQGVENEHLLAEAATAAFNSYSAAKLRNRSPRPVLLAAAPGELHTLPLVATAAAAADHQIECRLLGANIPYGALANAIDRVGPAAVMLWSQSEETGEPTRLASLPALRPAYRLLLGGPGWHEVVPRNAERVASIELAVAAMVEATA